jgi:uncharacterized membrane protein YeiH
VTLLESPLVTVLLWVGTITFAATGALRAVERRFDLVGVFVLAGVTAIGGGSIRDLLAGTIPPPALTNEPLLWAIGATALVVFFLHGRLQMGRTLWAADTASLGLFAGLGALTGLELGLGFWGVVFAGTVSGVGGGVIRDVLSGEVPQVLYRAGDFYAAAAACGAAVTWALGQVVTEPAIAVSVGSLTAIAVRVGSRVAGITLPVPRDTSIDI